MGSFEYRDLLVAVWSDEAPGYFRARAEEEFGRSTPSTRVYLPFDDRWFVQYADRLEQLNSRELHYLGARLFDCLFQGEILRLYVHLLEQIRNTGAKLRVRLELDPPIVARLPWECVFDTREGVFLSACPDVTLVRYRRPDNIEPAAVPARPPLKVLVAAESRPDGKPSRVTREARTVREALVELEGEGVVSVVEVGTALNGPPLSERTLRTALAENFDIVHLICEAETEERETRFAIGDELLSTRTLADVLETGAPQLVVWGGGERAGAVGPTLSEALLGFLPALICQRHTMPEELLVRYATTLYRSLGSMMPVDRALTEARGAVLSQFPTESEWLAPALFLSRKDATIVYNRARGASKDVYQISEGRYRRGLRENLNRFWPKPERYFPQNLRWMPREEPLSNYIHAAEFLAEPQSAAELASRFQRLLVLGDAGSGKSMAIYRLFYEAAQPILSYESKSPLPVYASLPELGESGDVFELLVKGFDRDLFLSDLEEGRFLFLLDALDGLSVRGAVRRTDALNAFMRKYPLNRFVVTARRPVPKALDIQNWAEMLPLADWEAIDFLVGEDAIRPEAAKVLFTELSEALGPRVGNPQILALARRLWREGARVPASMTEMFLLFFRIAGSSISPESRDSLLPRLAFYMTKRDRLSLLKEHLQDDTPPKDLAGLAQEVAFRSTGSESAGDLLSEIEKTRLLRGPTAFTFPNALFQEFLTAYALRTSAPNTILGLVPLADWRERELGEAVVNRPVNLSRGPFHGVLPFLCGLREDGAQLVERFVDRDLVLASECFRETQLSTGLDLRLRNAVERAFETNEALEERIACLSLEARGDRWAVEWLEKTAGRPGHARALALEALGTLRSYRSVPLLESVAEEGDPTVARAAQDALARIKAS